MAEDKGCIGHGEPMTEIAVIVLCFNQGRTIEKAVDSALSQTRTPAEIVLIDDGSTDILTIQTIAALRRPGLRVVRIENRGTAGARNYGARLTSSNYLVFLDGDDILERTYFEKAGTLLDTRPELGVIACTLHAFEGADYVWTPPPFNFVDGFARGTPPVTSMIRRTVFDSVGGFDESFGLFEVLDFWLSVLEQGHKAEMIAEPMLKYRVRTLSNYYSIIQPEIWLERRNAIMAKHRKTIEQHGLPILYSIETFILEQRKYHQDLEEKKKTLEREIEDLNSHINELGHSLKKIGEPIIDWGDFDHPEPLSTFWGIERGAPIDRYYINKFLDKNRMDIHGHVIEIKDGGYTYRYGDNRVETCDVLDINSANKSATIIADLSRADCIPPDMFDCFILTQTIHIIYDVKRALAHAYRILKPGGILLCTLPSTCRVNCEDGGLDAGDYWRFTEASVRRIFAEIFPPEAFEVSVKGNVKACVAFLEGLAAEEVAPGMLDHTDPWHPLLFCVRGVKPHHTPGSETIRPYPLPIQHKRPGGAILFYHRIAMLAPDPHALCIAPNLFRDHMCHLRDHYRPISLNDLVAGMKNGELPERALAVTLDDGYLDALDNAAPVLVELGIPATFFVSTDRLHEQHETWQDTLVQILLSGALIPPLLNIAYKGRTLVIPTTTIGERTKAFEQINEMCWDLSFEDRTEIVASVCRWSCLDCQTRNTHRLMTADEVLRLSEQPGLSIGCHGIHHLCLPAQPLPLQQREVVESKYILESLLKKTVDAFSYPYGEYDHRTEAVVRSAGFDSALTTREGIIYPSDNLWRLARNEAGAWPLPRFADWLHWIFTNKNEKPDTPHPL
jgi:peptidoglycan/xylan/chitin deacetylase (PgdA/CDA1 family)/glycosyltransferase involved in cell wall biosynthesis/SAM-dependent methyltransferase